ncbi:MAG: hypothetical protein U0990_04750 [Candidatus Nanopelagicales bacterium]|nr:hypothetical protein [Candidatus Nanopelagicales bacterium]MDZ4249382.1 hypothetical protein [Candidatus Nanopelagicales bacterium]MDZ7577906.1 hypothetical protein [Candidatus Nanopelagicales bacterium]
MSEAPSGLPQTPVVFDSFLETRARTVAGLFRVLAAVVLILWVVAAVVAVVVGITKGANEGAFFGGLLVGVLAACLALVYGIISWAAVTLLSLFARYMANRS